MNSGFSTWWSAYAAWIPLNTGSASHVSRGGRGWGSSVSHSSSPWCDGSAVSSRCSAVVPVRGSPVTNTGRSIFTSEYDGCAVNPDCASSRPTRALFTCARCM